QVTSESGSALAVFGQDNKQSVIWGLVDQQINQRIALEFGADGLYGPPGRFQIEITGPGIISIHDGITLIGLLRRGVLNRRFPDIFNEGPVAEVLATYADVHAARASSIVGRNITSDVLCHYHWVGALCRLLVGIRHHGHGGSLLLISGDIPADLRV